ncbi:MAG: hypothetical protein NC344_03650 [Bacteroidales bacterium]|nr:hypothetical protein [Bacteroidales bacterium]MCM1146925.1 hypothetical protein [Bacteroidales bacterium]MCM1205577.1 hypothetical protein [Bacillota bacterium]MCM1510312.1 hypothetical protein [Clostridium sp.]
MKRLTTLIFCCAFLTLSAIAGNGTWKSTALNAGIRYTTTEAKTPARDGSGKFMTIVYLENLACEKVGGNSNREDVDWLLRQGYRVIELDYANDKNAVSPNINKDIIAVNAEMRSGTFCGCTDISQDRAYILFEGYRILRDVSYYLDDKEVYNMAAANDSLYMDIVYPANPAKPVPVILSFSYSNSYYGNTHKRMFLPYHWAAFNDSFVEGAPAVGCAWAIADHPKYCDWGNGKYKGGANKSLGSIEIADDAARKVRSAIRTVRGVGKTIGLGHDVAIYGFSRGSTAGSLAIGDKPFEEWTAAGRGRFQEESSDVQAAFLGPGVFDYSLMRKDSREYNNMNAYCNSTADPKATWGRQGGALSVGSGSGTAPTFLFYNSDDDANYGIQATNLTGIFRDRNVTFELLKDYGTGHSVPQSPEHLRRMYDFLIRHTSHSTGISAADDGTDSRNYDNGQGIYSLNGTQLSNTLDSLPHGIYIAQGRKIIK